MKPLLEHEQALIQSLTTHDGWRVLEALVAERQQKLFENLSRHGTSLEDTEHYRGELAGLGFLQRIREAPGGSDAR